MHILTALFAALAMLAAGRPALARICTITSPNMAFGAYDSGSSSPLDVSGTVTAWCDQWGPVLVTMSKGSSPTYTPRTMLSGSNVLEYNMYLDAACTTIWGDGTGGTSYWSYQGIGSHSHTVYGRVPAGQMSVQDGDYSDLLVVSLVF